MTYEEMIEDVFIEHHLAMGMHLEDIEELIEDSTLKQREKFLIKIGYDLVDLFKVLV